MGNIVTLGEVLVEMVATEVDQKFSETGTFKGPYPSGAPAIFIDQAARCGSKATIVSAVGKDGFGEINLRRLESNGVDISNIKVINNETTGSAFVTYQENGERDFIFNITNAACGKIDPSFISESIFDDCSYLHIMGSSVYSVGVQDAIERSLTLISNKETKVSFDPNVRKEILNDPSKLQFLQSILKRSHIIIAGDDELEYLMGSNDKHENIRVLLNDYNAEVVVVKYGSKGSSVHTRTVDHVISPYTVEQVDPTGAGDCYAGTFVSCINQGIGIEKAAQYASAAGALAVSKVGPMEGNSNLIELDSFIANNQ